MAAAVLLTVASWSCTVLAFAAAAQAVGIEPTMGQAALLAAGTNLATAIPAAPGYVGTFELAAVTIAASVGIAARAGARVRDPGARDDAADDVGGRGRGPVLGGRRRRVAASARRIGAGGAEVHAGDGMTGS